MRVLLAAVCAGLLGAGVAAVTATGQGPAPQECGTTPTQTQTVPPTTTTTPPPVVAGSRPFSDASPFNAAIGDSPAVLSNSATIVANSGMSGSKPSAISTARAENNNWDHPTYYTSPTDPVATLKMSSTNVTFKVPVPNYAIPAGAGDHHIAIVAPDGWEYNLWNTTKSGTPGNYTFTAQIGGRLPTNGLGIKTPALVAQYGSQIDGGTEAKFSERAGMITAAEMKAGQINHALFVVASGSDGNWVYPGFNSTSKTGVDPNGTRPHMGTRFWLDLSDAAIDATAAPAWEKVIAHAAHKYGIYVGDKGGNGFGFMLESSTPYGAAGIANPWDSYWPGQGVRKDPTWGYNATFASTAIWSHLKTIAPPGG